MRVEVTVTLDAVSVATGTVQVLDAMSVAGRQVHRIAGDVSPDDPSSPYYTQVGETSRTSSPSPAHTAINVVAASPPKPERTDTTLMPRVGWTKDTE
jgi:hypothetical protein